LCAVIHRMSVKYAVRKDMVYDYPMTEREIEADRRLDENVRLYFEQNKPQPVILPKDAVPLDVALRLYREKQARELKEREDLEKLEREMAQFKIQVDERMETYQGSSSTEFVCINENYCNESLAQVVVPPPLEIKSDEESMNLDKVPRDLDIVKFDFQIRNQTEKQSPILLDARLKECIIPVHLNMVDEIPCSVELRKGLVSVELFRQGDDVCSVQFPDVRLSIIFREGVIGEGYVVINTPHKLEEEILFPRVRGRMWFVAQGAGKRKVYEGTVSFVDYKRRTRKEIMLGLLQGCIESNPGEKIYCVHNSEVSLFKVHIEKKVNGAEDIMSNFNDIVKLLPVSTYYALRPKRARATMVASSKKAFKFSYDGVFREYTPMLGIPLQVEFQVSYPIKLSIHFDGPGDVCLHTSVQMIDEMRVGKEFVVESGPLRIVSRNVSEKLEVKKFIRRFPANTLPGSPVNTGFEKKQEIEKFLFNQHLDVVKGKAMSNRGQGTKYFDQKNNGSSMKGAVNGRGRRSGGIGGGSVGNRNNRNVNASAMTVSKSQTGNGKQSKDTSQQGVVTLNKRKVINGLSVKILDLLKNPDTDQQIRDIIADFIGLGTSRQTKGALWINEQVRNLRDRKVSPLMVLKEGQVKQEFVSALGAGM